MDEMLKHANAGLLVNSVSVEQLWQGEDMNMAEVRRLELELCALRDHDSPYTFVLPTNMPQVLAWTRLLARVHCGELQP